MKTLLLVFLLATPVAWGQPRVDHDGPRADEMGKRLTLTDPQQKQFDKLQSDLQRSRIAVRSRIQTMRLDIRDAFREEKPDRGKIESRIAEIGKLQNEMRLNRLGFWFDVNKILAPEQQAIWKKHRGMRPHRGSRHAVGGPSDGYDVR